MSFVETKLRKWGNSFGVVIPIEIVEKEKMRENQQVNIIIVPNSRKALRETFGMGKGRLLKTGQQVKNELRRDLYND
ncbi:MAG: AbrB/MazE/SpoVT family DNA-binding domain-containing protein [Nanoarchaeota archaeon]